MTKNYVLAIGTAHPRPFPFGDDVARSFTERGFVVTILRGVDMSKAPQFEQENILESGDLWVLWCKGEGLELELAANLVQQAHALVVSRL